MRDGFQQIYSDVMDNQSDISTQVVDEELQNPSVVPVDSRQRKFDSAIHAVDGSGNPLLTPKGRLKTKRLKTHHKSRVGTVSSKKVDEEQNFKVTGAVSAALLIQLGVQLGGQNFLPRAAADLGYDEQEMLSSSFADYYKSKGVQDFPPGVALTIAILSYAGPRFTHPETRSRVKKVFGGIKEFTKKVFNK